MGKRKWRRPRVRVPRQLPDGGQRVTSGKARACSACGETVPAGVEFAWYPKGGRALHLRCAGVVMPPAPKPTTLPTSPPELPPKPPSAPLVDEVAEHDEAVILRRMVGDA